jgi:formate dehydrogenase maturation protein FdhE
MKVKAIGKIALLLIILTAIPGCSTKIAYHFLDNILSWQLNSYVDLQGEQKKLAQGHFKTFHAWHRLTQLPLYIEYLEGMQSLLDQENVSAKELHDASNELQDLIDISMQELLPALVEIFSTLSDEQVQELLENLDKDSEEYRDEYVDVTSKKQRKLRVEEIRSYVDRFIGRFSSQQKDLLSQWAESMQAYEALLLKQKQQWKSDVAAAMVVREDKTLLAEHLAGLVVYRTDDWDPELEAILDHNQELTFDMLAQLFNSRSESQRAKTRKKIQSYIETCRELHAAK